MLSFYDFICFAHIFSIISVSRQTLCTLPECSDLSQAVSKRTGHSSPLPSLLSGGVPDRPAGRRIVIPFVVPHYTHPNTSRSTSLVHVL